MARFQSAQRKREDWTLYLPRKLGRFEEARAEFESGASLTENVRQRKLLQRRAPECGAQQIAG